MGDAVKLGMMEVAAPRVSGASVRVDGKGGKENGNGNGDGVKKGLGWSKWAKR
jgi:hypothetical protein